MKHFWLSTDGINKCICLKNEDIQNKFVIFQWNLLLCSSWGRLKNSLPKSAFCLGCASTRKLRRGRKRSSFWPWCTNNYYDFFFYTYLSGLNIVLVQLNICYYCRTSDQNSLDRFTLTALSRIKSLKIASRFTFGKSKEIKWVSRTWQLFLLIRSRPSMWHRRSRSHFPEFIDLSTPIQHVAVVLTH
jgi:hypothetical protein